MTKGEENMNEWDPLNVARWQKYACVNLWKVPINCLKLHKVINCFLDFFLFLSLCSVCGVRLNFRRNSNRNNSRAQCFGGAMNKIALSQHARQKFIKNNVCVFARASLTLTLMVGRLSFSF